MKRGAYTGAGLAALLSFYFPQSNSKPGSRYSETYACQAYQAMTGSFSEASELRSRIHQGMGLTGKGITVRFLDISQPHADGVIATVNDTWTGIAPDIDVECHVSPERDRPVICDPQETTDDLRNMTQQLNAAIQDKRSGKSPHLRIINASISANPRTRIYTNTYDLLRAGDAKTIETIYPGKDREFIATQNEAMLYHTIFRRTEELHALSTEYQKALADYEQTCARLAEENITLVVSAGNYHTRIHPDMGAPEGSEMNIYGRNPHVIVAAASTHNGSHRANADIISFSSRGNSQWKPTAAAPGWCGTSYSSPRIAGYIALMLEKNPTLTPPEITRLIRETAIDTPAPEEAEGAGMVDPIKLLEATPMRP